MPYLSIKDLKNKIESNQAYSIKNNTLVVKLTDHKLKNPQQNHTDFKISDIKLAEIGWCTFMIDVSGLTQNSRLDITISDSISLKTLTVAHVYADRNEVSKVITFLATDSHISITFYLANDRKVCQTYTVNKMGLSYNVIIKEFTQIRELTHDKTYHTINSIDDIIETLANTNSQTLSKNFKITSDEYKKEKKYINELKLLYLEQVLPIFLASNDVTENVTFRSDNLLSLLIADTENRRNLFVPIGEHQDKDSQIHIQGQKFPVEIREMKFQNEIGQHISKLDDSLLQIRHAYDALMKRYSELKVLYHEVPDHTLILRDLTNLKANKYTTKDVERLRTSKATINDELNKLRTNLAYICDTQGEYCESLKTMLITLEDLYMELLIKMDQLSTLDLSELEEQSEAFYKAKSRVNEEIRKISMEQSALTVIRNQLIGKYILFSLERFLYRSLNGLRNNRFDQIGANRYQID
jgi:hypothetical protein